MSVGRASLLSGSHLRSEGISQGGAGHDVAEWKTGDDGIEKVRAPRLYPLDLSARVVDLDNVAIIIGSGRPACFGHTTILSFAHKHHNT
jgi:hypothetical protein